MSDEEPVLSWKSSDGAIGASQRRVGPSGRDAQSVDQGEVWATPVQRARVSQGGDGGVVGVSHLQHPSVDAAVLEKSGGGAARVEQRGETGRVDGKIGQF